MAMFQTKVVIMCWLVRLVERDRNGRMMNGMGKSKYSKKTLSQHHYFGLFNDVVCSSGFSA
jgi:hypothetical protein